MLDKTTAPAVDIMETEEEYLVLADLPGVDKRDLEVSGARRRAEQRGRYLLREAAKPRKIEIS